MKKLFFYAAAVLAAISFSACSDDDETTLPFTPENIAGTWMLTQEKGWELYDEDEKYTLWEQYPDEDGWYETFTFDKDGSLTLTEFFDEGDDPNTYNGSYSISGEKLKMNLSYYYRNADFEIRKLTESELVMFVIYNGGDVYSEYTATFKRIE